MAEEHSLSSDWIAWMRDYVDAAQRFAAEDPVEVSSVQECELVAIKAALYARALTLFEGALLLIENDRQLDFRIQSRVVIEATMYLIALDRNPAFVTRMKDDDFKSRQSRATLHLGAKKFNGAEDVRQQLEEFVAQGLQGAKAIQLGALLEGSEFDRLYRSYRDISGVWTSAPGSRLDADHPQSGVLIPCRNTSRALLDRMRPMITRATEDEIRRAVTSDGPSALRGEALGLVHAGDYSAFFAPFDWINDEADIVIVGVTPGKQQALEALLSFRASLAAGGSLDEAAHRAKSAASFKGGMRTLGARLMDHFDLHQMFGLASTHDLFGSAARRTHYKSVLRYPVLKKSGNYAGDNRITARPFMRRMIEENLAVELAMLPKAWLVPFGPNASRALEHLAAIGRLDGARILGSLLHPGGRQWNRYNVQLGLVSGDAALVVPGGAEVLRRGTALRRKSQPCSGNEPHSYDASRSARLCCSILSAVFAQGSPGIT